MTLLSKFGSRRVRALILVAIPCILLLLFRLTSSPQTYRGVKIYLDVTAKTIYRTITDPLFTSADVVDFYHGRSSRWKGTVAPQANTRCDHDHCHPVPQLIAQPSPTTFKCTHFDLNGTNPLVVVGVFSDSRGGQEELAKRNYWRLTSKEGVPFHLRHLVDIRFVLGRSSNQKDEKDLDAEHAQYGDLFRLDGLTNGENMDDGKTYGYYRALYEQTKTELSKRPVFVMKTDLDSFLVLPNILDDFYSFSKICASENAPAYWGGAWKSWVDPAVPPYFRGIGYAISYPLLAWIASTPKPLPLESINGLEDLRVGAWLWWLPKNTKLWLKDENWDAEDYDAKVLKYTIKVSIVHRLKNAALWREYSSRMLRVWKKAGRKYLWNPQPWQLDIIKSSD